MKKHILEKSKDRAGFPQHTCKNFNLLAPGQLSRWCARLRAGRPKNCGSIPGKGKRFLSLLHSVQAGSRAHPVSYSMDTRWYFRGGKVVGVQIWPLNAHQVRGSEWVESYLHYSICLMVCTGATTPYFSISTTVLREGYKCNKFITVYTKFLWDVVCHINTIQHTIHQ